jgi:hypothetical protein
LWLVVVRAWEERVGWVKVRVAWVKVMEAWVKVMGEGGGVVGMGKVMEEGMQGVGMGMGRRLVLKGMVRGMVMAWEMEKGWEEERIQGAGRAWVMWSLCKDPRGIRRHNVHLKFRTSRLRSSIGCRLRSSRCQCCRCHRCQLRLVGRVVQPGMGHPRSPPHNDRLKSRTSQQQSSSQLVMSRCRCRCCHCHRLRRLRVVVMAWEELRVAWVGWEGAAVLVSWVEVGRVRVRE